MSSNYSWSLVEILKEKTGAKSYRQAGLMLEKMTDGNLGQVKRGERPLTPEQAMFIAEKCGLDVGEVLVRLDMDRTKNPAVKEALGNVLKRIAGAIAGIILTIGLMTTPANEDGLAVS